MAGRCMSLLFGNAKLCKYSLFLDESLLRSRVLVCGQPCRGRKRTSRPPSWFVRREQPYREDVLSQDNKAFMNEVVLDHYKQLSSPLKEEPWPRNPCSERTKRTGLLGMKIGTMPQWTKDGKKTIVHLIQVLDNHVIRYTSPEEFCKQAGYHPKFRGYGSLVVGALSCSPWKFTKEYHNLFLEAGVPPKRKLTRFLITPDAAIQPGTPLNVHHFQVGDYVNCQAKTTDHGFQGGMKRWNFKGGPASHGSTKFHRKIGSIASGRLHGVWKGKKMPGHMGSDWVTARGLKIWRINTKYNVLYVQGFTIPGPNHCFVRIFDSGNYDRRCARLKDGPPIHMPTCYPEDIKEPFPENIYHPGLFCFTDPSIDYSAEEEQTK